LSLYSNMGDEVRHGYLPKPLQLMTSS